MCVMISEYLYQCGAAHEPREAKIEPSIDEDVEPTALNLEELDETTVLQL